MLWNRAVFVSAGLCLVAVVRAAPYPIAPPFQEILQDDSFRNSEAVVDALRDSGLMPDVLPPDFFPTVSLLPVYYNETYDQRVDLGNILPVPLTSDTPAYSIKPVNEHLLAGRPTRTLAPNRTLTLVLADPDATSRANPTKGQMCHWIVTRIPMPPSTVQVPVTQQEDLMLPHTVDDGVADQHQTRQRRHKTESVVEYMAPAPPPKTGKHRYVFVVLAPKHGTGNGDELEAPRQRPHFGYGKVGKGVMDWAEDNGLVPIGANFFYAENEKQ